MEITRCLKLRLYPNEEQFSLIKKTGGCRRFVYNKFLEEKERFYNENVKGKELTKEEKKIVYKSFKYTTPKELKEQYEFLKEVPYKALEQSRMDAERAYLDFFLHGKGKPRFKSRKDGCSFRLTMLSEDLVLEHENLIKIPKIGLVKYSHNHIPDWFHSKNIEYKNLTVSIMKTGKIFVSICCQYEATEAKKTYSDGDNQVIGLDFSPSHCFVSSNGDKSFGYKPFKQKAGHRLAHYQRGLARKKKGSKNFFKAKLKVARFEERIANRRRDWAEKESLRLVKKYKVIGVEDLNVKGMMAGSKNAKNYVDVAWHGLVEKLVWKSKFYDCHVVKANKWFASSQICHVCGHKNPAVKDTKIRKWDCPCCETHHDRDVNAAINLKEYALKEISTAGTVGTYACGGWGNDGGKRFVGVDHSVKQEYSCPVRGGTKPPASCRG